LTSGRRPVVKIIAKSLSQYDEKHVVPTPLSGIRVGGRKSKFKEKDQICGKLYSSILHHDNAPSHRAVIVNEFLTKHSTNTIEQLPNSDMALADFFLFPKLKLLIRITRFQSVQNMKQNSRRGLKSILETAIKYFLMI
jgi:hypothetical protein